MDKSHIFKCIQQLYSNFTTTSVIYIGYIKIKITTCLFVYKWRNMCSTLVRMSGKYALKNTKPFSVAYLVIYVFEMLLNTLFCELYSPQIALLSKES